MWWMVLGVMAIPVGLVFAMCKAAGNADRLSEEIYTREIKKGEPKPPFE